ncbi:hypothetical protein D3C84_590050 [compost metagenome]
MNGRTIEHLADFEEVFVQGVACRHGDVVLFALGVGEAQVNPLHVVLFDQLNRLRHAVLQVDKALNGEPSIIGCGRAR